MPDKSVIKDIGLAKAGEKKIQWVSVHMPVLNTMMQEYRQSKPFSGVTVAMCLHLEAKTAYLARTLKAAGAAVVACASNPLSTQDDVVAAMVEEGITVFAVHGSSMEDYERYLNMVLDREPQVIIDDGGIWFPWSILPDRSLWKKYGEAVKRQLQAVNRLRAMAQRRCLAVSHDIRQ